jgi:outer membrane receptor protein involved in Fe transport
MRMNDNLKSTYCRPRKAALLFSASALTIAAFAQPALAQTAPTAPPAADPNAIEVIVVTAQKREESLQNVPISITAFGTRRLEQLGVDSFADYAKLIPSLSYVSTGPGTAKV